jgi:NAD(P)-dependent dehydrogenase (short-subunit alcohol dehydrogenase family)
MNQLVWVTAGAVSIGLKIATAFVANGAKVFCLRNAGR